MHRVWRWVNEKPLGASLVAGLVLLAVPSALAWLYAWDLSPIKDVAVAAYDWLLIDRFAIALPPIAWLCIAAVLIYLLWFVMASALERATDDTQPFSLRSYTEDTFDGTTWRWTWRKGHDRWHIRELAPYCKCEGPLVPAASNIAMDWGYGTHDLGHGPAAHSSFVCLSMTCGRRSETRLPLHRGFDIVKSLVEEEIWTRCRRRLQEAQHDVSA